MQILNRRRFTAYTASAFLGCTGLAPATAAPSPGYEETLVRLAKARGRPLTMLVPHGMDVNIEAIVASMPDAAGDLIRVRTTPSGSIDAQLALSAIAERPVCDVAVCASFSMPDLAEVGAILPLDEFAERHEPAEFRDGILYDAGERFDGRLYGYQTDGDVYLAFYNLGEDADLARARYQDVHGVTWATPADWAEFDRQIAFFHDPDVGRAGGILGRTPRYVAWEWWSRFHAHHVFPFDDDLHPRVASDEGVEALEAMIRTMPFCLADGDGPDRFARFEKGEVFAAFGWGGSQKSFRRNPRLNLIHAPMPGSATGRPGDGLALFNWGWTFMVSAGCPDPELAYLVCLHAYSPDVSRRAVSAAQGFLDPFRASHYEDRRVRDVYGAPFLAVHRAAMENAVPDLYLARRTFYFESLGAWIGRALAGEVDPARALAQVAEEWELITEEVGRARQTARWHRIRDKYPHAAGWHHALASESGAFRVQDDRP